jgi:hypothetical protein
MDSARATGPTGSSALGDPARLARRPVDDPVREIRLGVAGSGWVSGGPADVDGQSVDRIETATRGGVV